ncbi:EFR1 family ferrodoxin [Aduncisulcus paluster]|uniref:EFR1 family ferrodoxin n=1 Tax=Aduncisulcus paluster TaxID=2918883 RepID=A0ABQ5KHZ8_9EUKA|nr:EFR1 family ferrodoxin [Aduncisulcus paluster]|eukprot:gnl/Carplike_NY0171/3916_a5285_306.p1 GENE.gnl/Carplike_NY0171/3916_a5285_306~~gnl/Carplike_NY0171/3916_a5285_306.p1  ORF type:complete len:307 (+),score=51.80 gnl/Carplike_NY0171/3916_a5285_306:24-923(+)
MKIAVCYVSFTGNTQYVAHSIKSLLEERHHSVDLILMNCALKSTAEAKLFSSGQYDGIYFGSPTWAWRTPSIFSRILNHPDIIPDISGVPCVFFATSQSSSCIITYECAPMLEKKGAIVVDYFLTNAPFMMGKPSKFEKKKGHWAMDKRGPMETSIISSITKIVSKTPIPAKLRKKPGVVVRLGAKIPDKTVSKMFHMPPIIESDLCIGCGLCVKKCPVDVLQLVTRDLSDEEEIVSTISSSKSRTDKIVKVVNNDACIGCFSCQLVCPKHAIHNKKRTQIHKFTKEMLTSAGKTGYYK